MEEEEHKQRWDLKRELIRRGLPTDVADCDVPILSKKIDLLAELLEEKIDNLKEDRKR